jgi:hypothetical protein
MERRVESFRGAFRVEEEAMQEYQAIIDIGIGEKEIWPQLGQWDMTAFERGRAKR